MKPSSQVNRRQLHQVNSNQSSVATPLFGAVCATVILLAALVHRYARTQYGPCTLDGARRTVHCSRSPALAALPVEIPDTTLVLSFKNDSDSDGRLIENAFGTLQRSNFSRFRRLRDLGLVRCGVQHIEAMTFVDLSDLRRLDLRNNKMHHLAKGTFGGISKLDLLLLSGNPLVELGANTLSGLTVSRVEFVDNTLLGRINELAFENSRISSVIFNRCRLDQVDTNTWKHLASTLRELVVINNLTPLTIDEDALNGFRLRRLMLVNDSLNDARFITNGDHDVINLDNNAGLWNSTASPLTGLQKKTRRLSLSGTSISRLTHVLNMSMFDELEELDIGNNHVRVFDAAEFSALDRLRVLDLSDNQVDEFAGDFEVELTLLEVLKLDRNRLETVPEHLVKPLFDRVKSGVTIADNPLHYNCELRWLTTTSVPLADVTDTDTVGDVIVEELFNCQPPVITNASVIDQSRLVCTATADPAPHVTLSADDTQLLTVAPSAISRNVTLTLAELDIPQSGNYTCTATNVAGSVNVTVSVTDFVRVKSVETKRPAKYETLPILSTPAGFAVTACLIVMLAYSLKYQ